MGGGCGDAPVSREARKALKRLERAQGGGAGRRRRKSAGPGAGCEAGGGAGQGGGARHVSWRFRVPDGATVHFVDGCMGPQVRALHSLLCALRCGLSPRTPNLAHECLPQDRIQYDET